MAVSASPLPRATHLTSKHVEELIGFIKEELVVFVALIIFWGTAVPKLGLLPVRTFEEVRFVCQQAGATIGSFLLFSFARSYFGSKAAPNERQRKMGFLVTWFACSLFFDVVWQMPLWILPGEYANKFIRNIPVDASHLSYGVVWWSYSLSDELYFRVTPFVVLFEVWWLFGNLPAAFGLWKAYKQEPIERTLVLFCLSGSMQCYNASVYMAEAYFLRSNQPVHNSYLGKYVYYCLNGGWMICSLVACRMSYQLLLPDDVTLFSKYKSKAN